MAYQGLVVIVVLLLATSAAATQEKKPNFVVIFCDDWGWGDGEHMCIATTYTTPSH